MKLNEIKPLGNRVLIKPHNNGDTTTKSGIILTDSATKGEAVWADVVAVGDGRFMENGVKLQLPISVGDSVLYRKNMGGVSVKIDDSDYLILEEHELLMVMVNQSNIKT
jgi:chaperonin GroES